MINELVCNACGTHVILDNGAVLGAKTRQTVTCPECKVGRIAIIAEDVKKRHTTHEVYIPEDPYELNPVARRGLSEGYYPIRRTTRVVRGQKRKAKKNATK